MRRNIEQVVQIFRANPDESEDDILKRAIADGIDSPIAMQLVALLPLAYGRVMLSDQVGAFVDTYICIRSDGTPDRRRSLNALPLWHEAIEFAKKDQEPFLPIAGRSPEVRAANAALHDGSKIEHLVWGPPVFSWPMEGIPEIALWKRRWLRESWNSPGVHSVSHTERMLARCVMVIAILIVLLAVGVLGYYFIVL